MYEPLARGYKTHNEFHKYRIKWKFISDSFYHMFKSKKNAFLLSFITDFTAENAPMSERYDVIDILLRLSLSIYVFVLCHKYRI